MSTQIAKKPLRQVGSVRELLVNDMAKQQLAAVAAKHMRPERMMRIMANAIRTTPQLAECEPLSLLGAMMTAASLGIEPNTPLGQCYLIPFKNRKKGVTEVQFIIGWKGMIALARRSGSVVSIHADVVYQNDEFSFEYGSNQHLKHKPSGERENPEYAYCYAKLTDGEAFIVLPWPEIIKTRDNSQGYQTAKKYGKTEETPWVKHEHAMAKKTAVRRLFDELPISIEEVSDAVSVDEQPTDFTAYAMNPEAGPTIDGEFTEADSEVDDGKVEGDKKEGGDDDPDPKPAAKQAATTNPAQPPDDADKVPQKYRDIYTRVMGDIMDGAPPDAALDFHKDAISELEREAPQFHAALMAKVAESKEGA